MKYFYYLFGIIAILNSGCDNYLDLVPENDIETIETVFEKREQAGDWLRSCYSFILGPVASVWENVAIVGADEFVGGDFARNQTNLDIGFGIADGLQMAQEPLGNLWHEEKFYACIRYINIFIEKIGDVNNMTLTEKLQWTAEIKALKAFCYFELIRRYGPIILVPKNIDANSSISDMQLPRSHVDTCIQAVVNLIDESMEHLLPYEQKDYTRRAYFSQEAALALKAKVLLYAASPLFNGNEYYANFKNSKGEQLFSPEYDPEKWKKAAEAAEVAIRLCESSGKKLSSGAMTQNTMLLNTILDIENSVSAPNFLSNEALFLVRRRAEDRYKDDYYSYVLPLLKSSDKEYGNGGMLGCISPSIKMVEMFYTEHGLPIEVDKTWDYGSRYQLGKETDPRYSNVVPMNEDVLNLHLRREPRFYACIAADRCIWQRGKDTYLQVLAYKDERFGTTADMITSSYPQNLSGYWCKKMTYSSISTGRYAAGLLALGDNPFPAIRLAELYLMKAEAWNEYEGPKVNRAHVYEPLNKVRERAGIPDIETAWKSYSIDPGKIDTKEGMRDIIRQEINIEFAFEGHRFWNLRRWKIAHVELNEKQYGWNILGESAQAFYNNFESPVVVGHKQKFTAPRDYLFPIRSEDVLKSGCVQNPNW